MKGFFHDQRRILDAVRVEYYADDREPLRNERGEGADPESHLPPEREDPVDADGDDVGHEPHAPRATAGRGPSAHPEVKHPEPSGPPIIRAPGGMSSRGSDPSKRAEAGSCRVQE